mmetsp:Transcript_99520/g.310064  ORF Transcript_99520/g.310064 Transcript_99520/m.310064 type:complete len:270 (-) Transcript_99520:443-1252(-)
MQHLSVVPEICINQALPQLARRLQVLDNLREVEEVVDEHPGVEGAHLPLPLQEEALDVAHVPPTDVHGPGFNRPEAHLDGKPVREDAEKEAGERQQHHAGRALQLTPGRELHAAADEAQGGAAVLDEAELPLAHPEKEAVEERLVLGEDLHDHAVVVDADARIAEQVGELAPEVRARLLNLLEGSDDHLLPHCGRQLLLPQFSEVLPGDGVQRAPDDPFQLRPRLRDHEPRVHPVKPLARSQEVLPCTLERGSGHLLCLPRDDPLPTKA